MGWIKFAVIAIVIALGLAAIYQWRADIMQVAYDEVFRQQVQAHLDQQKKEFQRLKEISEQQQEAFQKQVEDQIKLQSKVDTLNRIITDPGFVNGPTAQGIRDVVEQIRTEEAAKKALKLPPVLGPTSNPPTTGKLSPSTGNPSLDRWKATR